MRRFERHFNPLECLRIDQAANSRIRHHGQTWSVDSNRIRNERLGIAGEWAVCTCLGISEDPVFRSYQGGGDGGVHDILHPDGRQVEIKPTIYPFGVLLLPYYQEFEADLFILCTRTATATVFAAGYATPEDWSDHHEIRDFHRGGGPQEILEQKWLRSFAELVD